MLGKIFPLGWEIGGSQTVLGSTIKFIGKPELFRLILKFYFYKILFFVQVIKDQGSRTCTHAGWWMWIWGVGHGTWASRIYIYRTGAVLALFNKVGIG